MFDRFAKGVFTGLIIGTVVAAVDHFLLISERARLVETIKEQNRRMG